uniref:Uncharacterized protein n=1 Tax=Ceratitis capitata TaxID=7213 RepID=W8CAW3_CERCA
MASSTPLISENVLEELAFRRCTWWSNLIENFSERVDGVELDILSLDQQFKDDLDKDDMEDVEEAEEEQMNEDIDDINLMNMTTEEKRNTLIESEEVQDMLNATRPIIEEHERKWREAGLERIMNTFDSVRIENEVGGWMRRHSKVYSFNTIDSQSDTESSISDEMYHYIRSVKKNNSKQRSRNYIQDYRRCQNHHKRSHNHKILFKSTKYGVYDCPCCKPAEHISQVCCSSGKDCQRDLPAIPVHEHFTKHYRRDYSSSSDSDYSCRELLRARSNQCALISEDLPLATKTTSFKKSLHTNSNRLSMVDYKCSTPPRSNILNCNPTNTAPSKLTNRREAAKKALTQLRTREKKPAKPNKKNAKSKTSENGGESNEIFDTDLKKAIALSLQDYDKHSKQEKGLMHSFTPLKQADNEDSSTESLSSKDSNKKINSGAKFRSNKIKTQRQLSLPSQAQEEEGRDKENTFLSSIDNICNSTALNTVAGRKQLHSRLPSIHESTEIIPSSPVHYNIERNKIPQISDINDSAIYGSSNSPKMVSKSKKYYNSTARNAIATDEESAPTPPPLKERNKAGHETPRQCRVVATEPRAKKKRSAMANRKISLHDSRNVSGVISNNSATPNKVVTTAQSIEKTQEPKRLVIYTPNQKEGRSNEYFQVTEEILGSVVGKERARGFLKYNVGRLTFPKSSTVYYCPPELEPSSSESDDDPLLKIGCYGELCESDHKDDQDN